MNSNHPEPKVMIILLWICVILLVISNIIVFQFGKESHGIGFRAGLQVGLEQGQWDYINGVYHTHELWKTASPVAFNRTVARAVTARDMVCGGYTDQHPDYPIDCADYQDE